MVINVHGRRVRVAMSTKRSIRRNQCSDRLQGASGAIGDANATRNLDLTALLTYTDLAKLSGESVMTWRRRKMLGTGPRALVIGGRHVRFFPKDVVEWLENCAQPGRGRVEAA